MYFCTNFLVLIFGDSLCWYLITNLFGIESISGKIIVGAVIFILSVLTFFAFIIVNKKDNLLTRLFYVVSFTWLGCLSNFCLVSAFACSVFWLFKIAGLAYPAWLFKSFIVAATLLLSAKSIYNAYRIKVKKTTIYIKNLPSAWENKKIIHISDIHLGPILREKFFHQVIEKIKSLKPDAVFITGDFFDGSESDFSWVKKPLNNLEATLGVYYSLGNHDFILGADRVIDLLKGEHITILNNRLIEKEGMQIIGLDFTPDKNFDLKREVLSAAGYNGAKPSILLFHEPKDTVKSQGVGIDLQLSGHTHGGQMFPFNFLAKLYYHNHSHGIFRRGDYTLSVTAGVGTWGPPMRIGTRSEIVVMSLRQK